MVSYIGIRMSKIKFRCIVYTSLFCEDSNERHRIELESREYATTPQILLLRKYFFNLPVSDRNQYYFAYYYKNTFSV